MFYVNVIVKSITILPLFFTLFSQALRLDSSDAYQGLFTHQVTFLIVTDRPTMLVLQDYVGDLDHVSALVPAVMTDESQSEAIQVSDVNTCRLLAGAGGDPAERGGHDVEQQNLHQDPLPGSERVHGSEQAQRTPRRPVSKQQTTIKLLHNHFATTVNSNRLFNVFSKSLLNNTHLIFSALRRPYYFNSWLNV